MALTFTKPEQLKHLLISSLPEVCTNSADSIFIMDHEPIKTILDTKNIPILSKIRDSQVNKFEEINSNFKANLARTRSNNDPKDVFIQDIMILGSSIANKAPVEDMNLVYASVPDETIGHNLTELTSLSELTEVVKNLLQASEINKREIGALKNEIVA